MTEFPGIEANPHYETCMKAVEVVKEKKIDFLLAVGGGSVIDATKFIAVSVGFEGDPWDILSKGGEIKNALPLGTVLTLAATGSEMNERSVISRISTCEKLNFASPLVFPKFSVLDPEVTYASGGKRGGRLFYSCSGAVFDLSGQCKSAGCLLGRTDACHS